MRKIAFLVAAAFISFSISASRSPCSEDNKWTRLIEESGKVLEEVQRMPDQGIPEDLLQKASGVAIFPNTVSAGFVIGGKYGQGIIMVRDKNGRWSPPAVFTIAGGSFGWQIGGQATDFVLLIMNRRAVDGILQSQFKLGADADIAAGPVGRTAEAATDAQLKGGILSYSRSRGLFAGVKLEGAVITQHWDADEALYGRPISAEFIMTKGKVKMPDSAVELAKFLDKYPHKK
jgi:lipid-binding SYLF domain-containing protein